VLAVCAGDREGGRGGVGPVEDGHGQDDAGFVFEGGAPPAEFVEEDAEGPYIHGGADGFLGVEIDLLGATIGEGGVLVDVLLGVPYFSAIP